MSFVSSVESVNQSPYEAFKFEEVGDSVTIYAVNIGERNGEHGEFKVMEAVQWNPEAKNYEELEESLKLISFPLKTWLSNAVTDKKLELGKFYTITLSLKRDMKYTDKNGGSKKAKSDNFKIDRLGISDEKAKEIIKSYAPNIAKVEVEPEDTQAPQTARPRL